MQKFDLSSLVVDFVGGSVGHRLRVGEGRRQPLARAVGLTAGSSPKIVDATAGLGRDAFLLASLGAEVTLIERSQTMHRLLAEGMEHASTVGGKVAEVVRRMTLIYGDARSLLPEIAPQVVLVDPMHPPRKNTALVKKEMRLIREVVGVDEDAEELMRVAISSARNRVVLKWPQRADAMALLPRPSYQIAGKSTRYDVFVKANLANEVEPVLPI